MNYAINIQACSASLFIGQEPGESEAEFLERAKLAEGKHFLAFQVTDRRKDGKQKQFKMMSPYFVLEDEKERAAIITATFEAIGKAVIAAEQMKAKEPVKEASRLVLPPGFGGS